MENKHEDPKFKGWLDTLQQESWQLELIISGIAIFGLISSFQPVLKMGIQLQNMVLGDNFLRPIISVGFALLFSSILALTFFLILHIVLRGLWIGAIGLRYFSGDIDYDSLKYTDSFTAYLKQKIGSFDKYIATLEDACSLIFGLSFLLVFFFISVFVSFGVALIPLYIISEYMNEGVQTILNPVVFSIMAVAYLLTLLDFFTQGFLKRKKWIAVFYLPIYRVMSRVTLSFVYRPLLYNFLDNRGGKRVLFLVIPFFIMLTVTTGIQIQESNFHNNDLKWEREYANQENYYDQFEDNDLVPVKEIVIPSKIITSAMLPIFVKHSDQYEASIVRKDSLLKSVEDNRGLKMPFDLPRDYISDSLEHVKLKRFLEIFENEIVSVQIDNENKEAEWLYAHNSKGQRGYETVVSLKDLSEGLHYLVLRKYVFVNGKWRDFTIGGGIPFWYYPG